MATRADGTIPSSSGLHLRQRLRHVLSWLEGLPATALLILIYIWLCAYIYADVISAIAPLRQIGFQAYPALPFSRPLAAIYALLPLLWLRRRFRQPSDLMVLQLYLYVYVPTTIYLTMTTPMNIGDQLGFQTLMLGALATLELRRGLPPISIERFPITPAIFAFGLGAASLVALAILIIGGELTFDMLDLAGVYERRSELIAGQGGSLLLFLANWSSLALAPVCLIYGILSRRWWLVPIGLALATAAFAATSFRSHLFTPVFATMIGFALRQGGARHFALTLILVALALCVFPLLIDWLTGGLTSWIIHFRFIGNNGFLSAQYFTFFSDMPKGLYQDSIGRFFINPRYHLPIAEIVGSSFSIAGNHANGNLWADGFGNFGLPGVMIASLSALLLCWALDSLGRVVHPLPVVVMSIPLAFAISNTSVHSAMTSNGGVLLLLLLYLMPEISARTREN